VERLQTKVCPYYRGRLTVISEVFGAEVRTFEVKESAATLAAHAWLNRNEHVITWREIWEAAVKTVASTNKGKAERTALPLLIP
jgi:hypothetical protein